MNEKRLQNIEAEQAVLGSILIDNDVFWDVATELDEHDFADYRNAAIFETISSMLNKTKVPVDLLSLTSELAKRDILITVGGESYVVDLMTTVPTASHIKHYTRLVKDASIRRQLKIIASDIDEIAVRETNVEDAIDNAEKLVYKIATEGVDDTATVDIEKSGDGVIKKIEYLMEHQGEVNGVESGFKELDKLIGGFNKSDMIILAARPAAGKTSWALNVLDNITKGRKKNKALFFSLEMSEDQLTGRLLSSKSGVGSFKFRTGNITQDELEKIKEANEKLSKQKIYINDSSMSTIAKIKSIARKLKRKGGLDIIIVDYLQLIIPHKDDRRNQYMAVTNISKGLKQLAKELDVPVIALAQLSRDVEKRGKDAEPRLSDLRDSGSIEQDADIVLFIGNKQEDSDIDVRKIIVAKNRHGASGEVYMKFDGETTTFTELEGYNPETKEDDDFVF